MHLATCAALPDRRHSLSIERSLDLDDNASGRGVSLKGALNSSTDRLLLAGAEVGGREILEQLTQAQVAAALTSSQLQACTPCRDHKRMSSRLSLLG